ncbi:amino acid adenylation domain-containing protein [Pseudoalteromonas sp. B62]|uniref:amino acid adenylation domain-containing protein n=1 Tax=Pseudoalteromonas sp. B62 TaxID=630483 RepID=UPI003FA69E6F
MSELQLGMVFHTQLQNSGEVYHDIFSYHIKMPWDQNTFERAVRLMFEQHPVLRTAYYMDGDRPLQRVNKLEQLPLVCGDIRHLSENEQDQFVSDWLIQERSVEFDWDGSLFKLFVYRRTEDSFEFCLSFHHAVYDGWSNSSFISQLFIHYQNSMAGKALPAPQTEYVFRDFVALELTALADPDAKNYWLSVLEDAPLKQIPNKLKSNNQHEDRIDKLYNVPGFSDLSQQLYTVAKKLGEPLQSVLLSAHAKVLTSMSGHSQALSSVVVNGRPEYEGGDRGLGLFLNAMPVCFDLAPDSSWSELVASVAERMSTSMAHRHYPSSAIQRDTGRTFSEVIFNYTHFHAFSDIEVDLDEQVLDSQGFEQTNYDFVVNFSRTAMGSDNLSLYINFDMNRYDEALIKRMGGYYINVFKALLADVDQQHNPCYLLGEAERQTLVNDWNDTQVDYPQQSSVQQLFEQHVVLNPNAPALAFGEYQLTYSELNEQANQLAHCLKAEGVDTDTLVGLCMARSQQIVIGMLAVLKAGAAYVPIDPELPQERIDYIVEDSSIQLVLTDAVSKFETSVTDLSILCLDDAKLNELVNYHSHNVANDTFSEKQLAYVIYTSGSTGQPKGVMVNHQNIVGLISDQNYVSIALGDVVAQAASTSFDAATFEIWGALCNGAKVAYIDKDTLLQVDKLDEALQRESVSVMFVTTALLNQAAFQRPTLFSKLSCLLFGGEQVNYSAVQLIIDHGKPKKLLHVYGPTEATTFSTFAELSGNYTEGSRQITIGAPLANVQVYVMDQHATLLPAGAVGELLIGGRGVARGYLSRQDLTDEKFIINPFNDDPAERLYKTGDLVRWMPDGTLDFIGRVDHQVKVRGFRIEPGEIEHQLTSINGVKEALVLALEDLADIESLNKRLVAYVVPEAFEQQGEGSGLVTHYRSHLQTKLPEHMIPSSFVVLDVMPLTVNGKIDRKSLPLPEFDDVVASDCVEPVTETERKLCEIWTELLSLRKVSTDVSFFEMGGHSLMITKLTSVITNVFSVRLELRDIFENQTIVMLAKVIDEADKVEQVNIDIVSREQNLPLSFAQQRMWFVDQLEGSAHYNLQNVMVVGGHFDHGCFERALTTLIERHEVLSTRFEEHEGQAHQVIYPAVPFVLEQQLIKDETREGCYAQVKTLAAVEARRPFNLSTDLMLRARILTLSDNQNGGEVERIMLLTTHHIAFDGVSTAIFTRELGVLYAAYLTGQDNTLAPLPVQYADYAQWQRNRLSGDVLEGHLDYWRNYLHNIPSVHRLPLDNPRPQKQTYVGAEHRCRLNGELTEQINDFCQRHDVTLFMFLQTAFSVLLSRYSNETDIIMGTPIAGRTQQDTAELIGFFVNTLVLRNNLSGNPTFTSLLAENKQNLLDAFTHQHIPFDMLVDELRPQRSFSHNELYQVVLAVQNFEQAPLELSGLTIKPFQHEDNQLTPDYELGLHVTELENELELVWTCSTAVFEQQTLLRFADSLQTLIHGIIQAPETEIMVLPITQEHLQDEEVDALLLEPDINNLDEEAMNDLFAQLEDMSEADIESALANKEE